MNMIFIFTAARTKPLLELPELKPTKPTSVKNGACSNAGSEAPKGDCRCLCGSLLARVVVGGVELKCRRCKRTLLVPFDDAAAPATPAARIVEPIPVRRVG